MKHKIQIGIELNTDNDPEPEISVTPVDLEVPENIYAAAKTLQDYFDMVDDNPGDGKAEVPVNTRIPTIKIFGKTLSVPIKGDIFIRVK